ncbi:TBC domain protein, partial [Ostertagia ostertagi]
MSESRVLLTVAADVVIAEVGEPIRFQIEAKARVFHRDERFYKLPNASLHERYSLILETNRAPTNGMDDSAGVVKLDKTITDEHCYPVRVHVSKMHRGKLLDQWNKCISEWKADENGSKPAVVSSLILNGVPDVLRGEVWRLLAKVHLDPDLVGTYHRLLTQDCPSEQVILKDIHRTFPAHESFKEAGGEGQESLYKISKAYSLYDEEVSYCQGLSFLAASLLLHMSEEQAFCTLVKIMYDYQLRDLFKLGFDSLHLRFYQLSRLLEEYESSLASHLEHIGVETHMYASQWFLTLFTAKFPLQMVFFIIDLFLSE